MVSKCGIFMWVLQGDEYQYWCEVTNVAGCQAQLCSGESLHNSSVGFYSVQGPEMTIWRMMQLLLILLIVLIHISVGYHPALLPAYNHPRIVTSTLTEHPFTALNAQNAHFSKKGIWHSLVLSKSVQPTYNMQWWPQYMGNMLEDSIWQC